MINWITINLKSKIKTKKCQNYKFKNDERSKSPKNKKI